METAGNTTGRTVGRLLWGDFSWRRVAVSAPLVYALLAGAAWLGSDWLIFQPRPSSYRDGPEILKLEAGPNREWFSARYQPCPGARYTVLFSHGNGEDMGDMAWLTEGLLQNGFAVMAYDYRGYGTSPGRPSERGTYDEIEAVFRYLTGPLGVPPARVIVFGRSVGGGPSVELACRHRVGALVLESAFVSAFRVVTRWTLFPFDKYRNLEKLAQVRCPVFVIHGRRDGVVPFWHGQALYEAAAPPKRRYWVDEAGHNDLAAVAGPAYFLAWRDFAASLERDAAATFP